MLVGVTPWRFKSSPRHQIDCPLQTTRDHATLDVGGNFSGFDNHLKLRGVVHSGVRVEVTQMHLALNQIQMHLGIVMTETNRLSELLLSGERIAQGQLNTAE